MDFLVLNKVFITAEGRLAFSTGVGLFSGVDRQVSNQVGGPAETPDTLVTPVGPVARVTPPVFTKVSIAVKGFPTFTASVTLCSTVNPLVDLEGQDMAEGFPTLITLIRLFSSVNRLVFNEQGPSLEGPPTVLTLGGRFHGVSFLMLEKVFFKVEGRLAFGTFIAFPSVGPLMVSERKSSAETLATFVTFGGFPPGVGFLVLHRLCFVTRWTVTVLTLTWFFFSVNFLMPQVCVLTKSFPALVRHVGFVAGVRHRLHKKAKTLVEIFLVLLLHRRFLPSVDNPVLDKMVTLAEALPTFTTFIWCLPSLDGILLALI